MLYVMRLMNGDSIIADARDEQSARDFVRTLEGEDAAATVSIRRLPRFAVRFSPNDRGTLEVNSWDDATLDDVLAQEYPVLNAALDEANKVPFVAAKTGKPVMSQLREAHERNAQIIRKGLEEEQQRFSHATQLKTRKVAHK